MRKFTVFICLLWACSGPGQSSGTSAGNQPQSPLRLTLQVLANGRALQSGDTIPTTTDLWLHARVETTILAEAGDSITADFFANTKKLGSTKYMWHNRIAPDPHSRKPQPMIIVAAGFYGRDFVWTNAPPGRYALVAKTAKRFSATSAPFNITISP